jgi:hypothetical protein
MEVVPERSNFRNVKYDSMPEILVLSYTSPEL